MSLRPCVATCAFWLLSLPFRVQAVGKCKVGAWGHLGLRVVWGLACAQLGPLLCAFSTWAFLYPVCTDA